MVLPGVVSTPALQARLPGLLHTWARNQVFLSSPLRLCLCHCWTLAPFATAGAGPIHIKERQTVTWVDENSLSIVSEPEVQISYAKSLVTRAELSVCGNSQGVSIDVKVVVSTHHLSAATNKLLGDFTASSWCSRGSSGMCPLQSL